MIIKGSIHAPPASFISFINFEVVTNFSAIWRKRIREDEKKVLRTKHQYSIEKPQEKYSTP
jgi:hypothetical protein